MDWMVYAIVLLGFLNVFRLTVYMFASDFYELKTALKARNNKGKRSYRPNISIIIPAHNEGILIRKTLESLQASSYPKDKMEIIVVNDGSGDNTAQVVRQYISELSRLETTTEIHRNPRTHTLFKSAIRRPGNFAKVILINQKNAGKAAAMNNAIKNHATGKLIMCLDADSLVDKKMVENSVAYFRDREVVATASNVNIMEDGTVLGLVQRFEYILCGHMKKAQTAMNVEYIIGGVGSVFRSSVVRMVNFYDSNTLTEDIDLSMKIVGRGNKRNKLVFAADAITYTEPVANLKSLIRQRYRWKYGRLQTFYKNRSIFFNRGSQYSKGLTWMMLPFALVQECLLFLEPLVIGYLMYSSIRYQNPMSMIYVATILSAYLLMVVWSAEHLSKLERLRLTVLAPTMYFLIYLLTLVEYVSLLLSINKIHKLKASITQDFTTWKSPERSGIAIQKI